MSRALGRLAIPQVRGYASAAGPASLSPPGTVNFTLAVRAGPRYEPKAGVAHALKNFVYKVRLAGHLLRLTWISQMALAPRSKSLVNPSCTELNSQRALPGNISSSQHRVFVVTSEFAPNLSTHC